MPGYSDKRVVPTEALEAAKRIVRELHSKLFTDDPLLTIIADAMALGIIRAEMTVETLERFERAMISELMNRLAL